MLNDTCWYCRTINIFTYNSSQITKDEFQYIYTYIIYTVLIMESLNNTTKAVPYTYWKHTPLIRYHPFGIMILIENTVDSLDTTYLVSWYLLIFWSQNIPTHRHRFTKTLCVPPLVGDCRTHGPRQCTHVATCAD